jgi:hypothetical protein
MSSEVSSPESAMRLAVIEAALYRRANAWRDRGIADVHVERDVDAGCALAGQLHSLLRDGRDALAVDVLHREHVDARIPDSDLLAFVQIANADEHRVGGMDLWGSPADSGQLRRLAAEQRGERHAVDVAAQRRGGRVHVAVRVDPQEPHRQITRLLRPLD